MFGYTHEIEIHLSERRAWHSFDDEKMMRQNILAKFLQQHFIGKEYQINSLRVVCANLNVYCIPGWWLIERDMCVEEIFFWLVSFECAYQMFDLSHIRRSNIKYCTRSKVWEVRRQCWGRKKLSNFHLLICQHECHIITFRLAPFQFQYWLHTLLYHTYFNLCLILKMLVPDINLLFSIISTPHRICLFSSVNSVWFVIHSDKWYVVTNSGAALCINPPY